jgi:glutamate racemase
MTHNKKSRPIGIFDSGIGGLTVAKAVVDKLPHEEIIYFGDTAHLPYGDKSVAAIQSYAKKIADVLLKENCKLILIACNSASAAAYPLLQEYIGERALLINVIDPMIEYLQDNYKAKKVGLIGTKLTVKSQIYHKKIAALKAKIILRALATPLLVPAIEEGFFEHQIIDLLLQEYLSHADLSGIEALILGCTHYPVIKKSITKFYRNKVDIIDASVIVAKKIEQELTTHGLLRNKPCHKRKISPARFLVSDYTEAFAKGAKLFFGENIKLEHYKL